MEYYITSYVNFGDLIARNWHAFQQESLQVKFDRELVTIKLSCMHHQIPRVLDLIGNMLTDPNLITEEGVLESSQTESPEIMSDLIAESAYEKYLIGNRMSGERPELTLKDVKNFFKKYFVASNL